MAALNIKDPEVHELAMELAQRTRNSLTEAVKHSVRESIARQRVRQTDAQRVVERVMRIAGRIASRPALDPRTVDETPGYNEFGVPEMIGDSFAMLAIAFQKPEAGGNSRRRLNCVR